MSHSNYLHLETKSEARALSSGSSPSSPVIFAPQTMSCGRIQAAQSKLSVPAITDVGRAWDISLKTPGNFCLYHYQLGSSLNAGCTSTFSSVNRGSAIPSFVRSPGDYNEVKNLKELCKLFHRYTQFRGSDDNSSLIQCLPLVGKSWSEVEESTL